MLLEHQLSRGAKNKTKKNSANFFWKGLDIFLKRIKIVIVGGNQNIVGCSYASLTITHCFYLSFYMRLWESASFLLLGILEVLIQPQLGAF